MMALKLLWDYAYYWGVLSLLFFNDAFSELRVLRDINPQLQQAQQLNAEVQGAFRQRASQRRVLERRGVFIDQYRVPCLHRFNEQLMGADTASTLSELAGNLQVLRLVAAAVRDMLGERPSTFISAAEQELLGDYRSLLV